MTITMEQNDAMWKLVDQYNRVVVVKSGTKLVVGRGNCDVPLKSRSVNSKHAVVEYNMESNCPVVQDLDTENGTFVNDQKIAKNEAVLLSHCDKLRFAYDNAVYQVLMCDSRTEAELPLMSDQQRLLYRPFGTDAEQLRLQEVRRSSASLFPNGAAPNSAPQTRRRSVQGSDDDSSLDVGKEDARSNAMDTTVSPPSISHTDQTLSTFVDATGSPDEEEAPESVDVKLRENSEESPSTLSPPHPHPTAAPAPARAPLSFTVPLDASSPEHPNVEQGCAEEVVKKEGKDLASCIPPHLLRAMRTRETNMQEAARERREQERKKEEEEKRRQQERKEKEKEEEKRRLQEKKEKEKKEEEEKRREQERKEKEREVRERKARQEREEKEKEARDRRARARSISSNRSGNGQTKPALADSRRRNVTAGGGGSDSAGAHRSSRASSLTNGQRRSVSKNRQNSIERSSRVEPTNSLKTKTVPKRGPSTEKRRSSNNSRGGSPGDRSVHTMSDGKSYLMNKMLAHPQATVKQNSFEIDLRRGSGDGEEATSAPDSPPSDAGTYTIESDKEKPKSARGSSSMSDTNDTTALLTQTAKSLHVLEQNYKNGKEKQQQQTKRLGSIDIEETPNRRRHTNEDVNSKNMIFNVLSAGNSRLTPSDNSSDPEHSPNLNARLGLGTGLKERRSAAVRRSNSDTHKTNPGLATATSRARQLASTAANNSASSTTGPRRRMSSDNTPNTTPRKASNPMTASYHKTSSSASMSNSMTSSSFNRHEFGRFSLKQKQSAEKVESDKVEALRRRMEYDPRKQAETARTSRRKEIESGKKRGPSKERPRRTNSADTRPVTEGGRPAVPLGTSRTSASTSSSNATTVTVTTPRTTAVRRVESLNTGSTGRTVASRERRTGNIQPNPASLIAPPVVGSAFLDVTKNIGQRSQSVSNGDAACTEVAYDLLLVSSIQSMTFRLRKGFQELLKKLKEKQIINRSPTPPGDLYVTRPAGHFVSTNMELKEILENLKAMECLYQSLEARLIRDREETNALSTRGQTLGSCTENEYREEVSRITNELQGFRPIGNNDDSDDDVGVGATSCCPNPPTSRYESSF